MAEFVLTPAVKQLALRSMKELRGETVFVVSKETSKPIRIGPGGNVTANGGLGPHARFKVLRGDRPHQLGPVIRLKNMATGKFLAIKGGELTHGGGGEHCEFIVQQAQAAVFLKKHNNPKARIGFNPNGKPVAANTLGDGDRGRFFIFDCDQVVPPAKPAPAHAHAHAHGHGHGHGGPMKPKAAAAKQASKQATAMAAQSAQAQFLLTPQVKALALRSMAELKGELVFIVSKETNKPVKIMPNGGVTALGDLGPLSQFVVKRGDRRHKLGPVVTFVNVATGKYLAIKQGQLTLGSGGEHCEFIVEMANQAVFLKKHNNPKVRMGFNANGVAADAKQVQDGNRGRFFIFDAQQVIKL